MSNCIRTGAYVELPDYGVYAPADLFSVGGAIIARFPCDPTERGMYERLREVTHVIDTRDGDAYVRFDLGIVAVNEGCVHPA